MVEVVALGAVVELADPVGSGATVEELDATMQPRDGGYGPVPSKMLLAQRSRMAKTGRPHLYAVEFADLSDGRRIVLRDDRGWRHWPPNTPASRWRIANGREIAKMAILILDPDDNDDWERWVVEQLRSAGVDADPASVHAAPYQVDFGSRVQHELRQPAAMNEPHRTEVVALGAVLELADPIDLDAAVDELVAIIESRDGYYRLVPREMQPAEQVRRAEADIPHSYYCTVPREMMLATQVRRAKAGIPDLSAVEFADLSDGRRIVLSTDRGWNHWPVNTPASRWKIANGREITKRAILNLDPDDNDDWESWVIEQLRSGGVDADPASVHTAPYQVEFGARVQHELRQPQQ